MMKKLLSFALLAAATSSVAMAQQIQGDFDADWGKLIPWDSKGNTNAKGTTPQGWTISNVTAMSEVGAAVTGKDGSGHAVQLTNSSAVGQTAPAYITLGTTWATAETKMTTVRNADGGSFGGKAFTFRPDAISLDYKRDNSHGTSEPATVVAYLWKGTYTQKEVPGNTAISILAWQYGTATKVDMTDRDRNVLGMTTALGGAVSHTDGAGLIASLEHKITDAAKDWTHLEVPFTYTSEMGTATPEKINVILAATDYFGDRSGIVAGNTFTVDNVKLVYYHALSELKYDNQAVSGFAETTTSYDLSTQPYDASKLTYTVKGAGATAEKSYDEATGLLTITVKGNDYSVNSSSVTTYTVQFAKPATEKVTIYSNDLLIDLRGTDDSPMGKVLQTGTPIKLIEKDGSYSFLLENFNFQGLTIGDIRVDNLTRTATATGADYEGQGEVSVLGSPVNVTVNATVKGDSMTATIEIPGAMGSFNITVTFAPTVHIDSRKLPSDYAAEGRTIIELKRHFLQGWNSLILPIDVTTNDLATANAEVKAQEFSAASEAGLSFTAATDLKAGTPYLVFFSADADLSQAENTKYFAVNKVDFNNNIVTHGAYSFIGNYEKDFSATGLYGVADFDGVQKLVRGGANATIQPTSAYFKSSDANAQGMRILFDGTVTGINDATTTTTAPAAVYDLRGVKVSDGSHEGLAGGIYVQGGKKILVK